MFPITIDSYTYCSNLLTAIFKTNECLMQYDWQSVCTSCRNNLKPQCPQRNDDII